MICQVGKPVLSAKTFYFTQRNMSVCKAGTSFFHNFDGMFYKLKEVPVCK